MHPRNIAVAMSWGNHRWIRSHTRARDPWKHRFMGPIHSHYFIPIDLVHIHDGVCVCGIGTSIESSCIGCIDFPALYTREPNLGSFLLSRRLKRPLCHINMRSGALIEEQNKERRSLFSRLAINESRRNMALGDSWKKKMGVEKKDFAMLQRSMLLNFYKTRATNFQKTFNKSLYRCRLFEDSRAVNRNFRNLRARHRKKILRYGIDNVEKYGKNWHPQFEKENMGDIRDVVVAFVTYFSWNVHSRTRRGNIARGRFYSVRDIRGLQPSVIERSAHPQKKRNELLDELIVCTCFLRIVTYSYFFRETIFYGYLSPVSCRFFPTNRYEEIFFF